MNRTIAATVTGGDNFGSLGFSAFDNTKNTAWLIFSSTGKYPLYDVTLEIVDSEKLHSAVDLGVKGKDNVSTLSPEEWEKMYEARTVITVPNGSPNVARILRKWQLPDRDQCIYHIHIFARNGSFYQFLILKRIDGEWRQASRVYRNMEIGAERKLLEEHVDEKLKDQVQWPPN